MGYGNLICRPITDRNLSPKGDLSFANHPSRQTHSDQIISTSPNIYAPGINDEKNATRCGRRFHLYRRPLDETRLLASFSVELMAGATLGLEYAQAESYASTETDTITGKLAIEF